MFKSLSEELVWRRDIDEYRDQAYLDWCNRVIHKIGKQDAKGDRELEQ